MSSTKAKNSNQRNFYCQRIIVQPFLLLYLFLFDNIKANTKHLGLGIRFKCCLRCRQPDDLSKYIFIQHMGQAFAHELCRTRRSLTLRSCPQRTPRLRSLLHLAHVTRTCLQMPITDSTAEFISFYCVVR